MKKLAMAVVCFLAMAGLGVTAAEAAPYPGAVPTKTTILSNRAVIPSGARPEMRVQVAPVSGNAAVTGSLRMTCTHPTSGGGTFVRQGRVQAYNGPKRVLLVGPALWVKRAWSCSVHFSGGSTVFAASDAGPRTVTVR